MAVIVGRYCTTFREVALLSGQSMDDLIADDEDN